MNLSTEENLAGRDALAEVVVCLAKQALVTTPNKTVAWTSHPLLAALKAAGTRHIYTDTADKTELDDLLVAGETEKHLTFVEEIDGNTTNQALVDKVLPQYFEERGAANLTKWARELQRAQPALGLTEIVPLLYTIINGRLGRQFKAYYGAGRKNGRSWEISLELHTGLAGDAEASRRVAGYLARMVPGSFVKVAFTPHEPHCLLIARDLERQGIRVNFTTTFSVRQVAAAALLANVARTNIFMGRLNQGLEAELLGEQVDLAAQRLLRKLRRQYDLKTQLIVASVRDWKTLVHAAGCDVFTVPYKTLKDFLTQKEIGPKEIRSQLESDYSGLLGVSAKVLEKIGSARLAQLYQIEPDYLRFLVELRRSPDFDKLDGDGLFKKFDHAGFGEVFYSPTPVEWQELRKNKLPDLDSPLTKKLPLDTLYSLLAVADFMKFQEGMDQRIAERIHEVL
ncbi:MAG: transaldolase family protein [candidate division KSB1 bacterium]|nr:transaldolase family protein [candidate division KSB1 bacterium]MDZ7274082.1 transaldolase family protein [candidate division KSB1 bacterium]MDZ7287872.1 transaldolase family protein [candidate division KSB1 bacterium]MDZ7296682.1 transaldolase family protein [candidate division KSB1 bacterium]MDZ7309426.1 transaldolase family protein [candidate division KSB1 bacterium]